MNINKLFPSKYLKESDLTGEEVNVTISRLTVEGVRNQQSGEDEDLPVLYFEGMEKGLILNRTNADTVAKLYGVETGNWPGNRLTLYVQYGFQAFNQTWDVIRIRDTIPTSKAPVAPSPTPGAAGPEAHSGEESVTF